MSDYPYNFDAKIVKYDFGKMYYSVVYVPKEIVSQFDFAKSKRLRIDGEIDGGGKFRRHLTFKSLDDSEAELSFVRASPLATAASSVPAASSRKTCQPELLWRGTRPR